MPETQGSDSLPGILARIVATKRAELAALAGRAEELERSLDGARRVRSFGEALGVLDTVSLIAECKRRSPGAGDIRPGLDPADLARGYERAGASAMSVLTDSEYFGGSPADLREARGATSLPVLRKDFTIDPLHVIEARAMGADAVLLIVRILDDEMLARLHREAKGLGMSVLVEVHDRAELERAVAIGSEIIGINNRDLSNFTTDLQTTADLLDGLPSGTIVVSESGIRGRDDVVWLGDLGVDAILVGQSLLEAEDPEEAASAHAGVRRGRRE